MKVQSKEMKVPTKQTQYLMLAAEFWVLANIAINQQLFQFQLMQQLKPVKWNNFGFELRTCSWEIDIIV